MKRNDNSLEECHGPWQEIHGGRRLREFVLGLAKCSHVGVDGHWRVLYNTLRPHSALGYRPPAPAACNPMLANQSSQPTAVM